MTKIMKRTGESVPLDITKIQKQTKPAVEGLQYVSQSELEVDVAKYIRDGMASSEIQTSLVKCAVDKIEEAKPDWTFVAARLYLNDIYHRAYHNDVTYDKGLENCLTKLEDIGKLYQGLMVGFDMDKLNDAIRPERDMMFTYLGVLTWFNRYALKTNNDDALELPQYTFMGIAMFLALKEKDPTKEAIKFYNKLSTLSFMDGTPTISNARTPKHQLSSCFIGATHDSERGITSTYADMAVCSKLGGGIGWSWTSVRPGNSAIDGHPNTAGGQVPFLHTVNSISLSFDQLGTRKGAIAVYTEPWHLDINDFLDLKKNSGEERRRAHDIFPALWINDEFMRRAEEDELWYLFDVSEVPQLQELYGDEFKVEYERLIKLDGIRKEAVSAKELWKKILRSSYESASPFLTFKDNANKRNPNDHLGVIRSSNLCTEIFQTTNPGRICIDIEYDNGVTVTYSEDDYVPTVRGYKLARKITRLDEVSLGLDPVLLDYTKRFSTDDEIKQYLKELFNKSNLSDIHSINKITSKIVDKETAVCTIGSVNLGKLEMKDDLEDICKTAVRMLDNAVSLNMYPTIESEQTSLNTRAIGLGVMGEAEYLAVRHIKWGSEEHKLEVNNLMEAFSYYTIKASVELAKEKGAYPKYKGSKWSRGEFPHESAISNDDFPLTMPWEELRSEMLEYGIRNGYLMAIAPTSSISILTGTTQAIEPIYKRQWFEENLSGLIAVTAPRLTPETYEYYTPAYDVEQLDLIDVAAIRQKWLDQGQSLNIFVTNDKATGKYLNDIFMRAWKNGLKSTYYLRSESPEAKEETAIDRSQECVGCQ